MQEARDAVKSKQSLACITLQLRTARGKEREAQGCSPCSVPRDD